MTNNEYLLNQKIVAFINEIEKCITIELDNIIFATFFYNEYEVKKDIFKFSKYDLWVYTEGHASRYSITDYLIIK